MSAYAQLRNIKTKRLPQTVMMGPGLTMQMHGHAEEIANLYRGVVAKRTGKLAASATASTEVGGKRKDRVIGKVTVGTGLEYAALHEFGSKSNPNRQAARDLAEAAAIWKGARRA